MKVVNLENEPSSKSEGQDEGNGERGRWEMEIDKRPGVVEATGIANFVCYFIAYGKVVTLVKNQ